MPLATPDIIQIRDTLVRNANGRVTEGKKAKLTTVDVTLGALSSALRAFKDWNDVTSADLLGFCTSRSRRDCIRRALRAWLGEAEAQRRWADFFRQRQVRSSPGDNPKDPTQGTTLPVEVLRRPDGDGIRELFGLLYDRLIRKTTMRTTMTLRVNMSFIYGFVFGTPHSLAPELVKLSVKVEDIKQHLKTFTHDAVVKAYASYRDNSSRLSKKKVGLAALCQHAHLISVVFCDLLKAFTLRVVPEDFGIIVPRRKRKRGADDDNSKRSDDGRSSTGLSSTSTTRRLIVNRSEAWVKKKRDAPEVHCFNEYEVKALYLACRSDLECLLLTALFTTGMRIGGFCLMKRKGTVIGNSGCIGKILYTTEKGNVSKTYVVTPVLQMLMQKWVADGNAGEKYMFTKRRGGSDPLSTGEARWIFKDVAKRAGLSGEHVKPHTTRHTVAWTLHALGNDIGDIAKFVGHKTPDVTSTVYIAMDDAVRFTTMNIPWTGVNPAQAKAALRAEAMGLASAMASPFGSLDRKTFPILEDILNPSTSQVVRAVASSIASVNSPSVTVDNSVADRHAQEKEERRKKKREIDERLLALLERTSRSNEQERESIRQIQTQLQGGKPSNV